MQVLVPFSLQSTWVEKKKFVIIHNSFCSGKYWRVGYKRCLYFPRLRKKAKSPILIPTSMSVEGSGITVKLVVLSF